LRNRIEYDLKAQNISQLYRITIERLQKDYSKNNIDVVKSFLGLLWASKTGLYLDLELSVVLEQEFGLFEQDWIELYVVLDDLLSTSSGLLTFSSNEIKKGIELQVLNSNEITKFHEKVLFLFLFLFLLFFYFFFFFSNFFIFIYSSPNFLLPLQI